MLVHVAQRAHGRRVYVSDKTRFNLPMVHKLREWLMVKRKEGATYKEIAKELDRSESYVYRVLSYYKVDSCYNIEIPEDAAMPTEDQFRNLIDFSTGKRDKDKRVVCVPLAKAIEIAQRCNIATKV